MTAATTDGRPRDAELTARLLQITRDAIEAEGFASLRIEKIAREAGCSKNAIYRRWGSKEELTAAALLDGIDLGGVPDTGSTVEDLLDHAWHHLHGFARAGRNPGLFNAMVDPGVTPLIAQHYMRPRHALGLEILQRAIARGELPADTDTDLILDTIAGLTLFRVSVKPEHHADGIVAHRRSHRAIITALLATPPRRTAATASDRH